MKFGVNLMLWTTRVSPEHAAVFDAMRVAGADGVEVPVLDGDVRDYADLGRLLDERGLARTASMAFTAPEEDPSSPCARTRQSALDALRRQIERSRALGASVLCGPMYQTLGRVTGAAPTDDEVRRAADVVRTAAADAAAAGVTLAVEPLNRFEAHVVTTQAQAAAFVDRVGHEAVGVHFDTFHANIEERDPAASLRALGRRLRHVHASANDRGVPGRDHIDWPGVFAALADMRYSGWVVMEAFGCALADLAAAARIWRDVTGAPEDAAREGLEFLRKCATAPPCSAG